MEIAIYRREGIFLNEIKSPPLKFFVHPLPGGNYPGVETIYGVEVKEWGFVLNFYDSEFRKVKQLHRIVWMNSPIEKKWKQLLITLSVMFRGTEYILLTRKEAMNFWFII